MKKGIIILFIAAALLSCTAGRNESQKADRDNYNVGETVYVCGCPMMCCNSISKSGGGRCACNMPLRKATVSQVRDGRVTVRIEDGREKRFFVRK
ncbi:MAG: hypothetical protein ACYC7J_16420 [Syntrophales bacterium]